MNAVYHTKMISFITKKIEEQMERIYSVVRTLSPEKCKMFHREVRYVGCLLSAEEVKLLSKAS